MLRRPMVIAAVAATTVTGALIYSNTGHRKSQTSQGSDLARKKRDLGLGGAGIGGNAVTGSTELESASYGQHESNTPSSKNSLVGYKNTADRSDMKGLHDTRRASNDSELPSKA
ncbi:hypothetical protein B0J13DRAFT_564265 [Dactylonectria estremocensis]|uniref:Uncharacterized protein n=1 Tax=Dactylonectria estremocensis TaxID=1079267 RepID=A0A9P9E410_9HYPO|nr:hypothetical protein B0J13DRAFT_564265 [Dactylonectria estremocensis]